MLIIPYDTKSQSRNADFILIARRAIRHLQRRRRCRPLSDSDATLLHNPRRQPRPLFYKLRRSRHHNPRPKGPSNLRTFFLPPERSDTQPAADRWPQPSGRSPVNPYSPGGHEVAHTAPSITASFFPSYGCPAVRGRKYWSIPPGCSSSAREPQRCLHFPASAPCTHDRRFPRR